jgi:hypothetical protein
VAHRLSESLVRKIRTPAQGNRITYDTEVKGFGVRVTAGGAKAFVLNYGAAAFQDILHSTRCNCNAPKSGSPAQTPQAAIRFAFIRPWRALTRAAARSMTTASLGTKYGLPASQITAPTRSPRKPRPS